MNAPTAPRIVLPGELLGTAEEFVPGRGTYESSGKIYAALFGRAAFKPSEHAIEVEAFHAIPKIVEGELVYGRVDEVKTAMAIVTVLAAGHSLRAIPGAPEGTIHVSKAKDGYTDSLGDEFAPGDLVVARVLQSYPAIKLSTAQPPLGVVSARCQVCHALLIRKEKDLLCPRCGNREHRKIAQGYGIPRTSETLTHGGPPA